MSQNQDQGWSIPSRRPTDVRQVFWAAQQLSVYRLYLDFWDARPAQSLVSIVQNPSFRLLFASVWVSWFWEQPLICLSLSLQFPSATPPITYHNYACWYWRNFTLAFETKARAPSSQKIFAQRFSFTSYFWSSGANLLSLWANPTGLLAFCKAGVPVSQGSRSVAHWFIMALHW